MYPNCYNHPVRPELTIEELLAQAEIILGQSFHAWQQPANGADHLVVLATTAHGQDMVLKAGTEADIDAAALHHLQSSGIPLPHILAVGSVTGMSQSYPLLIMSRIKGRLLTEVADTSHHYLAQLVAIMQRAHGVTSPVGAGLVQPDFTGSSPSWHDYLHGILNGEDPAFNWSAITESPWVDATLLARALNQVAARVDVLPSLPQPRLLHGDLNPSNIFVHHGRIIGIIDWSYARFGDPLYDFARLRMNPLIRSHPAALAKYFSLLKLDAEQCEREETYYLCNLVEYVNWYVIDQRRDGVELMMKLLNQSLSGHERGTTGDGDD